MDSNELKKLMSQMVGYMARHGLQRIKLKDGDLELELEKPRPASSFEMVSTSQSPPNYVQGSPQISAVQAPVAAGQVAPEATEGHMVTSPIVGTFYASSTPSSPPFVKVGDQVQENSVVCIIEAMKVMNEVRAGKSGTIAQIYVESGHPVEFGTKIFRIT